MKRISIFFLPIVILLFSYKVAQTQTDTTKMFIFGHSLIDHRPPLIPTPSNETTVPHWVYLLAQDAGDNFAAGGQYGFLPQHANLPPIAQWGYDLVPGVWDSDNDPFSAADITTILITAGNFMQWQAPDQDYPGDPGVTPISATEDILDWVDLQEDSVSYYLYENWPDMAPYLNNGFPPDSQELANYHAYTLGAFHNWWLIYQDSLLISRPAINVRMIPAGPILSRIQTTLLPNQIPATDLYEDDAPHGRATLYFLAGLITYMAVYDQPAPSGYSVPTIVHPVVRNNYASIVNFIWTELQNFNDLNGISRVFYQTLLSVELAYFEVSYQNEAIFLQWATHQNPNIHHFEIERGSDGIHFEQIGTVDSRENSFSQQVYTKWDREPLRGDNYYRLHQINQDGSQHYSEVKYFRYLSAPQPHIYPNPTRNTLFIEGASTATDIRFFNHLGQDVSNLVKTRQSGTRKKEMDTSLLPSGMYMVSTEGYVHKFYKL